MMLTMAMMSRMVVEHMLGTAVEARTEHDRRKKSLPVVVIVVCKCLLLLIVGGCWLLFWVVAVDVVDGCLVASGLVVVVVGCLVGGCWLLVGVVIVVVVCSSVFSTQSFIQCGTFFNLGLLCL